MKKLLAMSLIGCMALSMVACGSGETATATTEPAAEETAAEETTEDAAEETAAEETDAETSELEIPDCLHENVTDGICDDCGMDGFAELEDENYEN